MILSKRFSSGSDFWIFAFFAVVRVIGESIWVKKVMDGGTRRICSEDTWSWAYVRACLAFNELLVKAAFELRISPMPTTFVPDMCSGLPDDETDSSSAE